MYSIERMSKVLRVSRSSYYYWLNRKKSKRLIENENLSKKIKSIYTSSKDRYGSPKITKELHKSGIFISRPRVSRLMRKAGLRSIVTKKFKVCTTDSKHNNPVAPNLLNRQFTSTAPGKVWVSDITYVNIGSKWLYLTIIMDLYDRSIVGWSLSKTLKTKDTVLAAWKMAITNRGIEVGLIFHSDRGVQYTSKETIKVLKEKNKNVIQSMSRKGNCWDNAVAENFFKIIKSELINHKKYNSFYEAEIEIFEFIEVWYNRKRSHQKLGYLSPYQFRLKHYLKAA